MQICFMSVKGCNTFDIFLHFHIRAQNYIYYCALYVGINWKSVLYIDI